MDVLTDDRESLFGDVFAHLATVESQPDTVVLDAELLKRAERSLDANSPKSLLWQILGTGQRLLPVLQQDPLPLTRLLERDVALIPFDELKSSISPEKLEEGLSSASVPVQLLCLAYLLKAADSPSGACFVAASSSLVQCLFTIWLSSEITEVAERSLESIEALLAVDSPCRSTVLDVGESRSRAEGQGLLWRRVFHDPDVYAILFDWTSPVKSKRDTKTKKGMQLVTISQARLFDFIVRTAQFDWDAITSSPLAAVEARYFAADESQLYGGLLRYAASNMIDSSDILMEVLRQDFFVKLLGIAEEINGRNVSPRLLQAIQEGAGMDRTKGDQDEGMHL